MDDERWQILVAKQEGIAREQQRLGRTVVHPGSPAADLLAARLKQPLAREYNAMELLRRPELGYGDIASALPWKEVAPQVAQQVEIQAKYAGYIDRQRDEIEKLRRHENVLLPGDLDYLAIGGLSNEVKQKLDDARPATLAQAARVPGVTPAAVSLLLIHLKKRGALARQIA